MKLKQVALYAVTLVDNKLSKGYFAAIVEYNGHTKEVTGEELWYSPVELLAKAIVLGIKQLKYPCDINIVALANEPGKKIMGFVDQWNRHKETRGTGFYKELCELMAVHKIHYHVVDAPTNNRLIYKCEQLLNGMSVQNYKNEFPPRKQIRDLEAITIPDYKTIQFKLLINVISEAMDVELSYNAIDYSTGKAIYAQTLFSCRLPKDREAFRDYFTVDTSGFIIDSSPTTTSAVSTFNQGIPSKLECMDIERVVYYFEMDLYSVRYIGNTSSSGVLRNFLSEVRVTGKSSPDLPCLQCYSVVLQ